MSDYFALDYSGPPFSFLGPAHLGALATVVTLNILLWTAKGSSAGSRSALRYALAAMIWSAEAAWHIWNLAVGTWSIRTMLPLNTCSILIWLSGIMLLRSDYRIYEFAYFLGIGGALQYLVTPDLGPYGFPHFRFFQSFASHGLLLTAPVYMTVVEGFRPTVQSLKRVIVFTNLYLVPVFLINLAIGSDYLMLNAKPATPSLLDLMPGWPYYIIFMELIGIATCLVLYAPFWISNQRRRAVVGKRADP
jgi:hypothetical integral membrane protein (TIGR02206 family)